jgi:flagellar hook-length control protein FliK
MSGVNVNSLSTKLDVLERLSSKPNPISTKPKVKDEITASSIASTKAAKPDVSDKDDSDSFSKELREQDRKVSYGKPAEAKPTGVKPTTTEDVEAKAPVEVNPLVAGKKKTAITPNEDLVSVSGTQQPILKFLDSMERELGIEPEEILAAFAAMSGEALVLPPEQSTVEFVQALNLNQNQVAKAANLYNGLLNEISSQDAKAQQLGKAEGFIHLNPNEWDMIPDKQALPRGFKMQQANLQSQSATELSNRFFSAQNPENQMDSEAAMLATGPSWLSSADVSLDQAMYNEMPMAPLSYSDVDVPMDMPEAEGFDMTKIGLNPKAEASLLQANGQGAGASFDMNSNADTELSELSEIETTGIEGEAVPFNVDTNSPSTKLRGSDAVIAGPVVTLSEPVKPEDIVQKADLLIKKGGGEIKMKMNPEGLGEVHLKVVLQEGKVDIQLMTDSQQAKKAIESELHNLKAVLAEGKMDLRDIKVDVSQNLGRQMQEQMADQQRENARQFLNYFRENFGSGRNAMAYSGAGKNNTSQNPDEVIRSTSSQRRANSEPGRLSVVA